MIRLSLVRHGRSAHVQRGLLDQAGLHRWRDAYDAAGILASPPPPPALVAETASADVVAASDLRRAMESAQTLAPARAIETSPHFREWPIRVPRLLGARLPIPAWGAAVSVVWGWDIATGRGAPPDAMAQARAAVEWLADRARRLGHDDATMVIVTHGAFRRILGKALVADGWQEPPQKRSYAVWSVWRFERDARTLRA